uniref:U3 small nucleolar RNA-associated protein 13 C-terminal domain-containing protein n=1 Tax=Globodera rostochiensis TaxID=31243 RepID=A0A914IFT9_GLORO
MNSLPSSSLMEIRKIKAFDVSSATAPTSVPDEPSSPAKLGGSFMPSDDEVYDTAFISSSSNCVAVATNSEELRIQSLDRAEHVGLVHGHTQSILRVDSPGWDDNLIASGSKDNSILFWRLRETKAETDVGTRQNEAKTFTADRIALATGHAHSVASIAFSRAKNLPFLVSVSTDTTLKLWPLTELIVKQEQEGEQNGNLKMSASATVVAHSKDINGVDVSANDKLCVTASMDKTAKLWHIDRKKGQLTAGGTLTGHKRGVWCARFSENQQLVATCSGDLTIKLFSLVDKSCTRTFEGHQFAVLSVLFIDNGTKLVSVDGGGLIKLWDVKKGFCVRTEEAHNDKIWSLRALPPLDETEKSGELCGAKARFMTGGADGQFALWADVSAEVKAAARVEQTKRVEDAQKLNENNAFTADRIALATVNAHSVASICQGANAHCIYQLVCFALWVLLLSALCLVICCFDVCERRHLRNDICRVCLTVLNKLTTDVPSEEIDARLSEVFAAQWNTNTRTYATGQLVLNCVLKSVHPEELLKLPNIGDVVKTFLPYSLRHYGRLTTQRKNVAQLNYTFSCMRLN